MSAESRRQQQNAIGRLLSMRPTEYFILIGRTQIEFLRCTGGGHLDVLMSEPTDDTSQDAFDGFCSRLLSLRAYFGQPLRVLVNNDRQYTYFSLLEGHSPAQLHEKLAALRRDDMEHRHAVLKDKQTSLFAWQAIDSEHLSAICRTVVEYKLRVLDITTLASQLILNSTIPSKNTTATYLYDLPSGEKCFTLFDGKAGVLFGDVADTLKGMSSEEVSASLESAYLGKGAEPKRRVYCSSNAKEATALLGKLLQTKISRRSSLKRIAFAAPNTRTVESVRIALSSGRLLVVTLAIVCSLMAAFAGVTTVLAGGEEAPIADFQHRYNTKLTLSRRLDSLRTETSRLRSAQGASVQTSALVSRFFQKTTSSLYLTSLSVSVQNDGPLILEVEGSARKESSVFTYHRALNELLAPSQLVVNSIRPKIQNGRGPADTLFTFKMSTKSHESED